MSEQYLDYLTISISFVLFWGVIIILILYPKLKLRKIQKRINNLKKDFE